MEKDLGFTGSQCEYGDGVFQSTTASEFKLQTCLWRETLRRLACLQGSEAKNI